MATKAIKPVAIIMGSQSDWSTMKHAAEILKELKIGHEALIVSAHRTPGRLYEFARNARKNGFKVVIAGAGGAAHLPGMTASMTPLPVFGVPMNTKALEGKDSLLSIMQMPPGIPGRHAGDRQAGRHQRRAAGGGRAGAVRRKNREAARRLARAADQVRGQETKRLDQLLKPGATIGILGGGQLGRMLALAAARLGLRCHIYSPERNSCAFQVTPLSTCAAYEDERALDALCRRGRCHHL